MSKSEKILFKRLPKAEQKRLNSLNRIPVAKPGYVLGSKKYESVRRKRWSEED